MSTLAFTCASCSIAPNHPCFRPPTTKSPKTTAHSRPPPNRPAKSSPKPDLRLLHLARQVTKLSAARRTLRKRLGSEPPILDAVSLASIQDKSLTNDLTTWHTIFEARNEVTIKWLWLVAAVARKAYHSYLEAFPEMRVALSLADITQEGVCGLMTGVEKWDPQHDFAFNVYAFYCIKHAILRAIENQSRPIRLPVHVLNKLAKMRRIRQRLHSSEEEEPTVDEVAQLAGVDRKEAQLYLTRCNKLFSIDAPVGADGGGATLGEFLVDRSVDVARQVERACTREAVAELVRETDLEELERSVLLLKYGLRDGIERMRAEVSRILQVRVEKVRRAELRALKKLRENVGDDITAWTELIS